MILSCNENIIVGTWEAKRRIDPNSLAQSTRTVFANRDVGVETRLNQKAHAVDAVRCSSATEEEIDAIIAIKILPRMFAKSNCEQSIQSIILNSNDLSLIGK